MTTPFDPTQGLIVVSAVVEGPAGRVLTHLALDTGATDTAIGAARLQAAGYDPAAAPQQVQVITASGVEHVPLLTVARLTALGKDRNAFPVLGLTLPAATSVEGVLGLDFLRGRALNIDFRTGQITLL
ncbi:MAG TPA: aspartyl protease family protein [Gemmataceae bacterium]|jgi:predicted aspartyl protease|nr:aspartyl protease family protein [Gemmataceae bacterium]